MITRAVRMNTQSHYSLCLFFTTVIISGIILD